MDLTIFKPGLPVREISILSPTGTRDAAGQQTTSWETLLTTRATIEDTASATFRYSFQNNVLAANATYAVTLRCPAVKITDVMQVVYGDRTFQIQAIDDVDMRHFKLVLACVGIDLASS